LTEHGLSLLLALSEVAPPARTPRHGTAQSCSLIALPRLSPAPAADLERINRSSTGAGHMTEQVIKR
jgi:hypothetical protein